MKRILALALLCATVLLCAGCGALFDRSYSSVTTHQEQSASDEDASILRAESYTDLVSCVQHFVSMGQESGTVHVYQYSGDIVSDLETACQEVRTEDPLGAYALENITYEYSRIVSYYECTFSFTYRRTLAQMNAIVSVSGRAAIREELVQAMSSFSDELVIRTSSYYSEPADLYVLAQEAYYSSPGTALGYPTVSITRYPETGSVRIVEIQFSYSHSQETMKQRAEEVAAQAALLVGQETAADETVAWLLYSRLLEQTTYTDGGSSSVYTALCLHSADSEGMALSYALLCQTAGITCQLVQGTLDDSPHCWNLITLGDQSWMVDVSRGDAEESFLHGDAFMAAAGYSWSRDDYPACDGGDEALPDTPDTGETNTNEPDSGEADTEEPGESNAGSDKTGADGTDTTDENGGESGGDAGGEDSQTP